MEYVTGVVDILGYPNETGTTRFYASELYASKRIDAVSLRGLRRRASALAHWLHREGGAPYPVMIVLWVDEDRRPSLKSIGADGKEGRWHTAAQ